MYGPIALVDDLLLLHGGCDHGRGLEEVLLLWRVDQHHGNQLHHGVDAAKQ